VGWGRTTKTKYWMPASSRSRRARLLGAPRACLEVLSDQDGAPLNWAVPPLDEEPGHPAVLVVLVPDSDSGAPFQGVSRVEGPAENPVGGGAEGDGESEGPVEDPGPPGRWEMQSGGAGLPLRHRCGKTSTG